MAFSGTVQIGEIDDYIGPGAECTKPVEIQKPKPGQVTRRVRRKKGDRNKKNHTSTQYQKI